MKLLVLTVLLCLSTGAKAQSLPPLLHSDSPAWHQAAQADAENRIRDMMLDPESMRFRNVKRFPRGTSVVICGEVNGKNVYGGYVGYKRFWADYTHEGNGVRFNSLTLASDSIPQIFEISWGAFCK